jgi:organic hydroperoxide reductase OsmC/OhrA
MSEHSATLSWSRAPHKDEPETYSRSHTSTMKGSQVLQVSSSVEFKGDADHADPEQMLVSALASCHMLFFLAIAEVKGFQVASYEDTATGLLEKNEQGRMAITRITLRPRVSFVDDNAPDATQIEKIHAGAHRNCFIANSISAEVTVEPA